MKKKLKIATMIASEVAVPMPKNFPRAYASIPIATSIAKSMVKKGHKVHFFSTKDAKNDGYKVKKAEFISLCKNKKINLYNLSPNARSQTLFLLDQYILVLLYQEAKKEKYDIIHLHGPIDRQCFPICTLFPKIPVVYTIHDPVTAKWRQDIHYLYKTKHQYLVSISNAQRKPIPHLNWIGTVYNGIDPKDFQFNDKPKDYLLFAGRIMNKKGTYEAIKAAQKTNSKLIIAGDHYSEKEYWDKKIKPNIKNNIKYVGFVNKKELSKLYKNAKASLMPIKWEPFGLTFIESMATGTPPIAFNRGSAKEIIKDKKSGFLVNDLQGMIKAIKQIDTIKRIDCRKHVEDNFSVDKMVDDYEKIYYRILKR